MTSYFPDARFFNENGHLFPYDLRYDPDNRAHLNLLADGRIQFRVMTDPGFRSGQLVLADGSGKPMEKAGSGPRLEIWQVTVDRPAEPFTYTFAFRSGAARPVNGRPQALRAPVTTSCRCGLFDILDSLVDKSLVMVSHRAEVRIRYRLLEPVRQFANERLTDAAVLDETLDEHARYFASFVAHTSPLVHGPVNRPRSMRSTTTTTTCGLHSPEGSSEERSTVISRWRSTCSCTCLSRACVSRASRPPSPGSMWPVSSSTRRS